MTLDAHQHFWQFDPVRDAWISEKMSVLRRDFLPDDLAPLLRANGVQGCIAVQADQSEAETDFLLEQARRHAFIQGVVGWVDLRAADLEARLGQWQQASGLCGFRHILQAEQPAFLHDPAFRRGIRLLGERGYTYDILVFPRHLGAVRVFLKEFGNQKFILDHLAKPYIRSGRIAQWKKDLKALARHPNLWCKVSGLVTEADWDRWRSADFRPYLDVAFEAFGPGRLVYGSDWPVCLVAAGYAGQKKLLEEYLAAFSPTEQAGFWGENGRHFYGITRI